MQMICLAPDIGSAAHKPLIIILIWRSSEICIQKRNW